MSRTHRRMAAPEPRVTLPDLTRFDGDVLETRHDYDALAFVDRDFTGQDATDSRFLECRMERCRLDGVSMRRGRVIDCVLDDVDGASIDLTDSTWRDVHLSRARFGAVTMMGATWSGILVRDSRLGFMNLAGADVEDVVLEGCEIGGLDARSAGLRTIIFIDCGVEELNVAGATLSKVDLSGARLRSLIGVESLHGAIVSQAQLHDLAPLLATQLGLEVRPDRPEDATR